MSGGSLEYLSSKINSAIEEIKLFYFVRKSDVYSDYQELTPYFKRCKYSDKSIKELKEFLKHLKKISQALHDIEWVMDCDKGPGDEMKAIRKCLPKKK